MSMSQLSSERQLAAIQSSHAVAEDGPDSFWPELIPELKLISVFSENCHWGLHLENSAGGKVMNAMTPSDVSPGAMIYHGSKDGIRKATLMAAFLANTQNVSYFIIDLCLCFEIDPYLGKHRVSLRLRVADTDTHGYADLGNACSICSHELSDRCSVFLLPYREEPTFLAGAYKVAKKALVLEEVNGGILKWGRQLGHINTAQMNGVGQHVFIGHVEFL
ncbi:hypothetical protein FMEXI_5058 [Fusarium mexicanum]|uniref:Uncharacterized protein n=1 Tax=Fusarium mexicanum TaxID=751941 RepID=A0A8H5N0G2_9HYPO|nr:hypothetical protein FMEXI_5058 [Fusarium mexicanum]